MRFRNTLILGIIFIALGAYLYFVEFERAAEQAAQGRLFDFLQEDVDEVVLIYPDRKIALAKVDGTWRITAPVDAPADESASNNLVRAIAECEIKKRLDDVPDDLGPFGLVDPDVVIRVKIKGGALPEIRVGGNTPVGYSTYIQRADNPKVLLTGSDFQSGMQKKVADLRDKTIVQFTDDAVRKVAIVGPDRDILLVRSDDHWKMEQPSKYDVDDSSVRSFLSTLRSMRATGFPDENPLDLEPYGIDIPRLSITLFLGEDEVRKEIFIGKDSDESKLYVKTDERPTIYEANNWIHRDLNKNVNDFRDKTVLAFDKDTVTAVKVEHSYGAGFELQKINEKTWILVGIAGEVEGDRANQFVSDIRSLNGYEIAADEPEDLEAFGLASPALNITLRGESDEIGTIKLGSYLDEEGKEAYSAMREGTSTVFRLRDYLYTRLHKNADLFLVPRSPVPAVESEADEATPGADL